LAHRTAAFSGSPVDLVVSGAAVGSREQVLLG
jgi:hypothetical protein